jgi:bifunctional DNA-binding transcriptional regulator/antitoxin component of YhaV-PrlF toxin-antitoxin module
MCDTQTHAAIDAVVSRLTSQNMMFTAFDVTKEVWKELGHDASERWQAGFHNSIKGDVHQAMAPLVQTGTYQRSLEHIGAPAPAFVYYPAGGDPSQYQSGIPQASPAPAVSPLAVVKDTTDSNATNDDDDDDDDDDTAIRSLTKYGRLTVPNVWMKHVGFHPGDTAYLDLVQTGRIAVVKDSAGVKSTLGSYVVDEDVNIRILKHALAAAGLDITGSFKFLVQFDKIIIENA